MPAYTADYVNGFLYDALVEYLDSDRFKIPAGYDSTVASDTLFTMRRTVLDALENAAEYATVADLLDAYDLDGQHSERLFTYLNERRFVERGTHAPAGIIAYLIADADELSAAMEASLHQYIYDGACEFLKQEWERDHEPVEDSVIED